MKKSLLSFSLILCLYTISLADAGYTNVDAAKINLQTTNGVNNYVDARNTPNGFNLSDQGTKSASSYFHIKAAEAWIYKNNGSDVTGGNFHYRIYKSGSSAGSFTTIAFSFGEENGSGTVYQRWGNYSIDINILASVNSAGTWVFECYWSSPTNGVNCSNPIYLNSGGSNYSFSFTADATFPVELSHFSIFKNKNKAASLSWSTASEFNNSHFNIERSADSRAWEVIGKVEGKGTTLEHQDYTFTDHSPLSGKSYYRLQQMDFDGRFEYSKILTVEFGTDGGDFTVSPNPVGDQLLLSLPETTEVSATVFDIQGKIWLSQTTSTGQWLTVGDIPAGVYFVKITTADTRPPQVARFVKK